MTAALLNTKVQARIGAQILKQLTRDDPSETTLDSDVLDAACEDAIGDFERETGIAHDTTNMSHVSVLVDGALYKLEQYKSRDGNIISSHSKAFYAGIKSMRDRVFIDPVTNSQLVPSEQRSELPKMDKDKVIWNSRLNRGGNIRKTFSTGNDNTE